MSEPQGVNAKFAPQHFPFTAEIASVKTDGGGVDLSKCEFPPAHAPHSPLLKIFYNVG